MPSTLLLPPPIPLFSILLADRPVSFRRSRIYLAVSRPLETAGNHPKGASDDVRARLGLTIAEVARGREGGSRDHEVMRCDVRQRDVTIWMFRFFSFLVAPFVASEDGLEPWIY